MYFKTIKILSFLVWILISAQAFADAMQERRVTISASIFPRLVAVDLHLLNKLDESGNVRLGLIYQSDKGQAKKVEKLITRKINKIAGKTLVFDYIDLNDLDLVKETNLSGIFLTQTMSSSEIRKVTQYSNLHNILSFSPFEGDVERGVMASIFVGAKIRPYFNIKSLNAAEVKLKPSLLKVSKAYE